MHIISDAYESYRSLLQSIAYRMLGSYSEAEDIVQDVFVEYMRLDSESINNEKAYLIRMLTNRCLNLLQSARKKKELYPGSWLPEPEITVLNDPAELYVERETLSYALLVMLEQLSPAERAVFILKESLKYSYSEIAACLHKSEVNCRKIYQRAKTKLQQERTALPDNTPQAAPLISAFIAAAQSGSYHKLVELLTEDAILISDGGGKVRAAYLPILRRERVLAFLKGVISKGFLGEDCRLAVVNGQAGIILMQGGQVSKVISFQLDEQDQRIERIFIVLNPEKLGYIHPS